MSTADRLPDPLDVIWRATAARLGLRIVRRPDVFASYDGAGTLALGADDALDPDDNVAQMVLHEICHWIVAGPDAIAQIDWGFAPMEDLDPLEFPTIRLQRALADRWGLAALLAPTTDARAYWDRLTDPLAPLDDGADEAWIVARAAAALARADDAPWGAPLIAALSATAAVRRAVLPLAPVGSSWA